MAEPLGLESKMVRVVPYDARWPGLYRAEAERVARAVAEAGLPPLALEHVGSTAVPGLAAKPVLDLAGGREREARAAAYRPVLEGLGYVYRGDGGLPGRDFFRRGEPRSHHLHLVERGGAHWRRYLGLREALRADPALREAYASLKRELAVRYARDREAYTEGKSAFVDDALARAGIDAPRGVA